MAYHRRHLPKRLRIGRAVYTRLPATEPVPFTKPEAELLVQSLELLLSSGLIDGQQELAEDLRTEFLAWLKV